MKQELEAIRQRIETGNDAIISAAKELAIALKSPRNVPYSYDGRDYLTPEEVAEKIIRKVIRQTRQR